LGKVTPPGQKIQGARTVGLKVGFNVVGTEVVGTEVVGTVVGTEVVGVDVGLALTEVGFNVVGTAVVGLVVVGIDVGLGQQTGSANWTVAHSLSLVKKFAASTAA
jgi:hypothetical protein